jgi:hypothetical protein
MDIRGWCLNIDQSSSVFYFNGKIISVVFMNKPLQVLYHSSCAGWRFCQCTGATSSQLLEPLYFCSIWCLSCKSLLCYTFNSLLCCLFFFDLRILITPLVSSNFSYLTRIVESLWLPASFLRILASATAVQIKKNLHRIVATHKDYILHMYYRNEWQDKHGQCNSSINKCSYLNDY